MRVWKQWTSEHQTTRKIGSGRWKVMSFVWWSTHLHMEVNVCTASSRQMAAHWSTATGVLMLALSIHQCLLHHGLDTRVPLCRIPFTVNHRWLYLQWAVSTEPCKLIGTKLSFQMHHASICGTMMAKFMLDIMLVNTAFQNVLSNSKHPELWSGVKFCIMDDRICYELRVISLATSMSMKCYSPKSFLSFKASLELSFSRIMHIHMLQRLFETSV